MVTLPTKAGRLPLDFNTSVSIGQRIKHAARSTPVLRGRWRQVIGAALTVALSIAFLSLWGQPGAAGDEWLVGLAGGAAVALLLGGEFVVHFLRARGDILAQRLGNANEYLGALDEDRRQLQEAVFIQEWDEEEEKFATLARPFWRQLQRALEALQLETPLKRRTLRDVTVDAPWPDDAVGSNEDADLSQRAFRQFTRGIYPLEGEEDSLLGEDDLKALDDARWGIARVCKRWRQAIDGPQGDDVAEWLMREMKGHEPTLKIQWYLDEALVKQIGTDEDANYSHYEVIRDVFCERRQASQAVSVS